jgi:hypothetical protein
LITNSWVLTAKHCLPADPAAVRVGFGMDANNFHQVRRGVEIQRFPEDRNLALLGVDRPFEIDESSTNHYINLVPWTGDWARPMFLQNFTCVGWDLAADPSSPTNRLKTAVLAPRAIENTTSGEMLKWEFDPARGTLLTAEDTGCACFLNPYETRFLVTVHTGQPESELNGDVVAHSPTVGNIEVHKWVEGVLFRDLPTAGPSLYGPIAACAIDRESMDVFGFRQDGRIGRFRRSSFQGDWQSDQASWEDLGSLDPPEGVDLSDDRPGVLCSRDGSVQLFVTGIDGSLWRKEWLETEMQWNPDWERVTDAQSPITSGATVVGTGRRDFHVYARGSESELRHARFDQTWTGNWENLGSSFDGTPYARLGNSNWIDVFVRRGSEVWGSVYWDSPPRWVWVAAPVYADPAVATWAGNRGDLFSVDQSGRLLRKWYELDWLPELVPSVQVPPESALAAVARERGSLDVVASKPGGALWHATWPRKPRQ